MRMIELLCQVQHTLRVSVHCVFSYMYVNTVVAVRAITEIKENHHKI